MNVWQIISSSLLIFTFLPAILAFFSKNPTSHLTTFLGGLSTIIVSEGLKTTVFNPREGLKTTVFNPREGLKTTVFNPREGLKTTVFNPREGLKTTVFNPRESNSIFARPAAARDCNIFCNDGPQGGAAGFPSTHSASATFLAFSYADMYNNKEKTIIFFIWALILYSRIALKCHTWLQIISGSFLGALIYYITH
jgi:membrane-associated phospholipid phosphatase